ncbi:hypothetical protein EHR02_00055 [Leptospira levettii]|uniref:hypothetical protein n=1 Tax=Leptospira levettii TaxID=2023178 RepID=UPI001082535F|nr:hypothetical protein [Leptospira levettii]TGM95030.1 hypothetical protein EHR02_00055 [Leptospira levettii]
MGSILTFIITIIILFGFYKVIKTETIYRKRKEKIDSYIYRRKIRTQRKSIKLLFEEIISKFDNLPIESKNEYSKCHRELSELLYSFRKIETDFPLDYESYLIFLIQIIHEHLNNKGATNSSLKD